ncbi:MAG: sigma-70 family RNA polymerase sigma factor [Ignavibacteriaceae bacterium]|nr:sigma-70 family RNA polymerase sigma factor [Ignavibacteriaceae bacterium]
MENEIKTETILELKKGSTLALRVIYNFYSKKIFFFINSYTYNKEISEELVQDVFIRLWNNRETIEIDSSINSYIYTIAKNMAIDFIRKKRIVILPIDSVNQMEISNYNDGELKVITEQEESLIKHAIDSLPLRQKEVFELHRNYNLTYKQISTILDISVSAVEKNISSALKKLKFYLQKKN